MQQELQLQEKKKNLIKYLLAQGILVDPPFLEKLQLLTEPSQIALLMNEKLLELSSLQLQPIQPILLEQSEHSKELPQKQTTKRDGTVRVISSYVNVPKKTTVQDFIGYFNARYATLKKVLQQRSHLENALSVNKLRLKNEREVVSIIGIVYEKEETKNGVMITVEDPTGSIKVFFSKNKPELIAKANDVVLDEVIGIVGSMGKNIIFGNELFFPDIPVTKELKKSPLEEYVAFISDIHIGSKQFLEDEFLKFIAWIRGEAGNDKQREIASKVKYLFITGDMVDGISIYPSQKDELTLLTFKEQYDALTEYLKMIPDDIQIIIAPGNHDVVPIAEPQPALPAEYCKSLFELPNVTLVSNPAIVNIARHDGFPGFDVLMYHGYSYNYYADKVESIRIQKPNISERADLVMRMLLQKRHLAPTHDANPHLPTEHDHMIIERVPDIYVSGDVHRSAVFTYKGVITGIIGSCFQSQTSFQEKVGHVPDPGRVPIINLKTREVKVLNFGDKL